MTARPYKPGPSAIHGLGVITTRLIRKGEHVRTDLDDSYRGFNHACDATLSDRDGHQKFRVARRDIEPGSELTVNYRVWLYDFEFICNCPKCRKEIAK